MGALTRKFYRIVAAAGMAISSVFEPIEAKSTSIEPITRKETAGDEDIIGSQDAWKSQGKWERTTYFDERLYRYTKLDDIVNYTDYKSGKFWNRVTSSSKVDNGVTYYTLEGVRNDGEQFAVSAPVEGGLLGADVREKVFDKLCTELNANLA
jgi:hypothetical protein